MEIKEISDDTAPIQGGKKIIIVCHKLKLEKNEKIIPEFCYLDETKNIWFTAPVSRDEASLKSYEGVAISLKTPQIFQNQSSSVKVSSEMILSFQLKSNNAIFTGRTLSYQRSKWKTC